MSGEWKVFTNIINGRELHIVGRKKDTGDPLHSGNVEYVYDYTENRDEAERLCAEMNRA